MLQAAKSFLHDQGQEHVQFVLGDAEKFPFESNQFTHVACRIAAHHFPDVEQFIKESTRVLQPNGIFLLIDNVAPENELLDLFYNTVEKMRDPSHHRAWKKSEWLQMMEKQHLQLEQLIPFYKTFDFDDWCERVRLSEENRHKLEQFMLDSQKEVQDHFQIEENQGEIIRFTGQAVLIKARKL